MSQSQEDTTREAIKAAGGPTAVGERCGVGQSAVSNWISRGRIPEEHCPVIELLGQGQYRCEQLRPDVVWTRREDGQITGYHVPLSLPSPRTEQQPSETGVLT